MSTENENKWGLVKTILGIYACTIGIVIIFKDKIKEWWND